MSFETAVQRTLRFEGGYADDPNDPGGETNWGISKRSYPDLDIRRLTKDEAIAIYRRDYWDALKLDRISPILGAEVFDHAVNAGPAAAVELLQSALVRLGYPVAIDGRLGPATRRVLEDIQPVMAAALYRLERVRFYARLAERRASMRRYLVGWLRRALGD